MKDIKIERTKRKLSACNICYARNYEDDSKDTLGEYTDTLFDLLIGMQSMCLCRDCLKRLSNVIDSVD